MTIFPSTKPKKKISKKEAENYFNLNEAFDLIGEKLSGENWNQVRGLHLSYSIVENINDMISNDFFDVYDRDDFDYKLSGSKKPDLIGVISHSEFLTRIRNRDKNLVVVREPVFVPSMKITDSMRDAFANKYGEGAKRKSKQKRSGSNKEREEYSATVAHDEVIEINYSKFFPENFLIPQEQFNYGAVANQVFLRNFCDSKFFKR
jgi:hypothetical protein